MFRWYKTFLHGVSVHPVGALGVILVTSSFVVFIFIELLQMTGAVTNTYVGLVTYLTLPALFVLGLLLIPVGWFLVRRKYGRPLRELAVQRFGTDEMRAGFAGSRLVRIILLLTVVNVVFLGAASTRMLMFMDSARFCGTACHSVMNPEWTTYQASPHAHVPCVACHVGEGIGATIDAKINGAWQVISASFDLYERPIPTPVHTLRPARETCEKCHWPDRFYGTRLKTIARFDFDWRAEPRYTTLGLKIGSGAGTNRGEIHWHVAEHNEVRYASIGDRREDMIWVEARQADGSFKRFNHRKRSGEVHDRDVRVMDCVDCHNRATHIYEDPEVAVDARLQRGLLDPSLPRIKAIALAALTHDYPDMGAAMQGIDIHLRAALRDSDPQVLASRMDAVDRAIACLQAAYRRNIHPGMHISWNAYPSHLGHRRGGGCFRCHNADLVDESGRSISQDCTLCHSILAHESPQPFTYLKTPDPKGREYQAHRTMRSEFLNSFR